MAKAPENKSNITLTVQNGLLIDGSAREMNKGIKRLCLTILAVFIMVLIVGIVTIGRGFFSALRTFGVEDRIHGTFFPVCVAIDNFAQTNGVPPQSLIELVPAFLPCIPTSPYIDKIEYKVVDGSNWIMNAHSKELKPWRIYSWRSNWIFSDEEKSRMLKQFHNLTVLKD